MDHNGSVRAAVERMDPASYLGVDIEAGPGVDRICDAAVLEEEFGRASFDVVLSTEMLEHVPDWRLVVTNMKHVLAPGGVLVATTRSFGYPYHGAPSDFWRYELDDMKRLLDDMDVERLESDPMMPGVFVKARKRPEGRTSSLDGIALYSMIAGRRVVAVSRVDRSRFRLSRYYQFGKAPAMARRLLPRTVKDLVARRLPFLKVRP